jgi:hypothetical protein
MSRGTFDNYRGRFSFRRFSRRAWLRSCRVKRLPFAAALGGFHSLAASSSSNAGESLPAASGTLPSPRRVFAILMRPRLMSPSTAPVNWVGRSK